MRAALVVSSFLAVCFPATSQAHFIWIVPKPATSPEEVVVYFGDRLKPDKPELLRTIAHTKLTGHESNGKTLDFALTPRTNDNEGQFVVRLPKKGLDVITGHCKWGVHILKELGESTPFLLHYHVKSVAQGVEPSLARKPIRTMKAQIVPTVERGALTLRVLYNGKPVPRERVTILVPGEKKVLSYKTKRNGECRVRLSKGGVYAIWVLAGVEKKAGEHAGKKYEEVRHYATLTVCVSEERGSDN